LLLYFSSLSLFHLFFVDLTATRYHHYTHHVELTSFSRFTLSVLSPIEPPSSSAHVSLSSHRSSESDSGVEKVGCALDLFSATNLRQV
jgi:hypothetical protein